MNVEIVRWLDSGIATAEVWRSKEDILSAAHLDHMEVMSAGFVMHEDDQVLLLAVSHDEAHDHFYGVQGIAKRNILARRVCGTTPS